jgi:hypothetical protein
MTRGVFFLASAIVIAIVSFVSARPALAQRPQASEAFVEEVEIRGNRRIPRESVLMPVSDVPFRMIFTHNPGVEDGVDTERKNVIRFSAGRTF